MKYLMNGIVILIVNNMKPPLKNNGSDDFQTPKEALYPLYQFLKKNWVIWECAEGTGNLTNALRERESILLLVQILILVRIF